MEGLEPASVDLVCADVPYGQTQNAWDKPIPFGPMWQQLRRVTKPDAAIVLMAASPHWAEGKRGVSLRYFYVTDAGRAALAEHLREIGDPHRAFSITFDGHTRAVVAVSRSKARYSHFLDLSEVMPDLKFVDYCRRASVRAAS